MYCSCLSELSTVFALIMQEWLPISTKSEGGFFSNPTYSLRFYMFFPFLLYPKGVVGEGRSVQVVLDDLRSWDFITSPVSEFTPTHQDSTPFTPALWLVFYCSSVRRKGEGLDNKTNWISFLPYLEVFVGILIFLWTYHHGFWKAEGWILSQAMSFIIASFQNQLFLIAIDYASSLIWWFDEFFFLLTFYMCFKLQRQIEQNR